MGNLLNFQGLAIAQKSLDALWLKQKVVSGNLANIDTPGYKSQTVEFEKIFEKLLDSSEGKNTENILNTSKPQIVQNNTTQMREDGNNIDVVSENIELTRTKIQYDYMIASVCGDIARLKYVINEGR